MADPAWVALSLTRHLGGKTMRSLLGHFNHDLTAISNASIPQLQAVPGVGPRIAAAIHAIDYDETVRKMAAWTRAGVQIITRHDSAFPPPLRTLDDAPPTLFSLGQFPDFQRVSAFAVVGTRQPTTAAQEVAQHIGATLADAGYPVISGLALGIDAAAHMGALSVPSGCTVAVLGSGVLNVYPVQNRGLAQAVQQRGALICEVAPDAKVATPGLVARNRIITGLCDNVIIIETGIDGGAMHAARFARLQGRRIWVLDLPASGNQALLADGARLLTRSLDGLV